MNEEKRLVPYSNRPIDVLLRALSKFKNRVTNLFKGEASASFEKGTEIPSDILETLKIDFTFSVDISETPKIEKAPVHEETRDVDSNIDINSMDNNVVNNIDEANIELKDTKTNNKRTTLGQIKSATEKSKSKTSNKEKYK